MVAACVAADVKARLIDPAASTLALAVAQNQPAVPIFSTASDFYHAQVT